MGRAWLSAARPGRRDLLLLQLRRARLAGRDPRPLEPDPAGGAPGAAAAGAAALPAAAGDAGGDRRPGRARRWLLTLVGPFGFAHGFNKVAGSNTYGPVSPIEALGIWPASNYRLDAVGGAHLTGLAGAIAILALLVGVAWWVRRRELTIPIALGACAAPLPRLAALQRRLLPGQGADDHGAAGDAGRDPPAARRVPAARTRGGSTEPPRYRTVEPLGPPRRRPSPGAGRLGGAGGGLRRRGRSTRASWCCATRRSGPPGHGAELRGVPADRARASRCSTRGRTATRPTSCSAPTPTCRWSSSPTPRSTPNPEKPFDTGDAYSPIDFDSFSRGTLDRFPYVITGRAAWNSQAPPNFRRVAATPSFVLWERTGPTPRRPPRAAGGDRGRRPSPAAPRRRSASCSPTRAAPRCSRSR